MRLDFFTFQKVTSLLRYHVYYLFRHSVNRLEFVNLPFDSGITSK